MPYSLARLSGVDGVVGEESPIGSNASDKPTNEQEYRKYRARYEQLRDDLMRRDRQAQTDPFALQRWPLERKAFADRVQQALTEWEVFGHKCEIEASGSTMRHEGDHKAGPHDASGGAQQSLAPEDC